MNKNIAVTGKGYARPVKNSAIFVISSFCALIV